MASFTYGENHDNRYFYTTHSHINDIVTFSVLNNLRFVGNILLHLGKFTAAIFHYLNILIIPHFSTLP